MESGFGISYFHKKPEENTNIIRAHMKEDGGRLYPAVSSDRTRGSVHKVKHDKFHLNMRKTFFEGSRALEQASQRGCGASSSGGTQNIPEHVPVYPALADPAAAGVLAQAGEKHSGQNSQIYKAE